MSTLIIAFGAGGRLGRAMLPMLTAADVNLVAVGRGDQPMTAPGVHWMQVDVRDEHHRTRASPVLHGLASAHHHVVLLDLVLDRRSVATMQCSIGASSSYLLGLGHDMAAVGRHIRYVLASTTATLAPWILQTPYGLAKRRQLSAYLAAAEPATAVMLPSLLASTGQALRCRWTYEGAAGVLSRETQRAVEGSRIVVPIARREPGSEPGGGWAGVVAAHFEALVVRRDSPTAHRRASHARLRLLPTRWRSMVDHHLAPELLVRQAARRYRVPVERCSP